MEKDYEVLLSEALSKGYKTLDELVKSGVEADAVEFALSLGHLQEAYDALWGVDPRTARAVAFVKRRGAPRRPARV